MMSKRWVKQTIAATLIFIIVACSHRTKLDPETAQNSNQNPVQNSPSEVSELNIWLEQGYNLEEDEAIRQIAANWEQQTGDRVKLSFFSTDELTAKAQRAAESGNVPDILMNPKGDRLLYPQLAWQDKLEDVADLIEPIKDDYPNNILQSITYTNPPQGKRSYYAVPLDQISMFVFYWQDLLASIDLDSDDIPHNWDGFWQFWQQAQTKSIENNQDIKALGLPLGASNSADDTYYLFEQILEAYDVALFDRRDRLAVDRPQVRQGIIKCLSWYARLYRQGYIPLDAVKWSNVDNNRYLLNRQVLMTPNATFSIPATVNRDRNTYLNRLGVVNFPYKPSGKPMRHLVSVRQAVIFKDSLQKSLAKDFLRYYIQPQVKIDYLKASNSRTQPVRASVWSDPFLQNTQDPYLMNAKQVLTSNRTKLFYTVKHPGYSQVLAENVWGKALNQVTADQISPEQAADRAIARIKEIFLEWDRGEIAIRP